MGFIMAKCRGWMLGTVGVEGNLIDGCGKIKFAIKELGFESSL